VRRPASAAAALLLCGCTGVQTPLDPAGEQAASIHTIWTLMLWVCGFFYVLVIAGLVWAIWRNRRVAGGAPQASTHDPGMERGLAIWSAMIFVGLTVLATWSFFVDRSLASTHEQNALHLRVTGYQWWWKVEYQEGPHPWWFETANEIHLPVGKTARIELESGDVIHSFWVPNLSGKMDLIPGRHNVLDVTPTRVGVYRGQCAEFCGFQHAHMALTVIVEPQARFDAWRLHQLQPASTPATPDAQFGQQVFQSRACGMCHTIAGTDAGGRMAPNLTHIASRPTIAAGTMPMSKGALAGWISDPQGIKPGSKMPDVPLTTTESSAVVAYLSSLQ